MEFCSIPEFAELVEQEWGDSAGRNVAIAQQRIDNILGTMSPGDRAAVEGWFDALPADHAKAVMRALIR